jgi:hypothetical protein
MRWADGRLRDATVRSTAGAPCRLRSSHQLDVTLDGKPVYTTRPEPTIAEFDTQPGNAYQLTPSR